jgi:hypothetical protein
MTVTSGSSGTGNGTVTYSVAANTSTSSRPGSLTIAGHTLNVTQAGACGFTVSPTSQNIGAAGGTQTATVTTTSGCAWTAVSNNTGWMTITGGSSGTGNGTVTYSVAANTSTSSRPGSLTIAGHTLNVTQAGACAFTVSPTSQNVGAAGGTQTATVTTTSGCAWTAVSNNTGWMTVTGGSSGTGNGTVTYNVAANTSTSSRPGSLTIAGHTLNVTQAGACGFTVSPTSQNVGAAGGTQTATVTTTSGCAWTAVSNDTGWMTVTGGGSGNGNGTVTYSVAAKSTSGSRSGTLTIAGQTLTVTQAGTGGCSFTLSPTAQNVASAGGTQSASVTTNPGCSWTAASNSISWMSVLSGSSGNGSGTVTYKVNAKTTTGSRTGTLTIAGQTLTVTQSGPCNTGLTTTSHSVSGAGGQLTNTVTTAAGCVWTAVSNATWITVTSGSGNGNGTASYTVAPNPTSNQRIGTLTIGGRNVTVTQSGGSGPSAPTGMRFIK